MLENSHFNQDKDDLQPWIWHALMFSHSRADWVL